MVVSSHVIRHRRSQFVNDTDFPESRRILVCLDLHFDVVRDVHRDASRLSLTRHAKQRTSIGRVFHHRHIALGIRLLVSLIVPIARGTEVRSIAETQGRSEDVADGLNLISKQLPVGNVEAIQLGRGTDAEVPVVHIVEALNGVYHLTLVVHIP